MNKIDFSSNEKNKIKGAKFSSLCANIKYKDRLDLILIFLEIGSIVTGVFTNSRTKSPSVIWSKRIVKSAFKNRNEPIAIIVNSGNANAFTGKEGTQAIEKIVSKISKNLKINKKRILMASTGVIGELLPYKKITEKIPELIQNLSENQLFDCAKAIMTTDTYPKLRFRKFKIDNNIISIAGIAKGSGMIAPNMATMLSFIITDIKISYEILQQLTSDLSNKTFNSITVDSDTSTSDMVLVSSTANVNMNPIEKFSDKRIKKFSKVLELIMKELALDIVKDGEGTKKLVEYQIMNALNDKSAKIIALSVANSPLVKTAIAGEDPNWGRIIMAIGKSGENIIQEKIKIYFGEYLITINGKVYKKYNEKKAKDYMKNSNLLVRVDLGIGKGKAKVWGCDFTKEYIEINADYRS
ncbi:MAG: bifunctional glutamate N-acetyltransferase/amino-acid acetyltransferase ArgJ [Paracoccaceae bacterium]